MVGCCHNVDFVNEATRREGFDNKKRLSILKCICAIVFFLCILYRDDYILCIHTLTHTHVHRAACVCGSGYAIRNFRSKSKGKMHGAESFYMHMQNIAYGNFVWNEFKHAAKIITCTLEQFSTYGSIIVSSSHLSCSSFLSMPFWP